MPRATTQRCRKHNLAPGPHVRHRALSADAIVALAILLAASRCAPAAEWQWTVPVEATQGCAYLWIPPSCRHMRGLIVSDANMLERLVLDHAAVRAAAEKAGLGMVLFIPKTFRNFKYKEGADKILLDTLANLATASGYAEIESAPLLPLGNSASTPFAWYVGYWKPERTIAVISCKGSSFPAPEFDKSADARDVPALAIVGEYMEWPSQSDKSRLVHWLTDREVALRMRNQDRRALLTLFVDVSRGHFDWSDGLAQILAMYIAKAAEKRLPDHVPAAGSVVLKTVDPASGWLIDANTVLADHAPPAPVHDYAGDRTKNLSENRPSQFGRLGNMEAATSSRIDSKTFWAFDQEMAEAIDRYGADQKTKAYQMVTFVEDGVPLEGAAKGYADIRFAPSAEDEMVFRLAGTYLDRTPAALSNQPPLTGHSSTPLYFECMGGPLVQLTPDTFRLRASKFFPNIATELQMLVCSPGDEHYRAAFQPGKILVPANTEGRPQQITFREIPDQTIGTKSIRLEAASDANLPVEFFVKFGPAEVEGDRLILGRIPPRSKLPIKVCVVAWQPGRMRAPQVQAAPSVEQTFLIRDTAP